MWPQSPANSIGADNSVIAASTGGESSVKEASGLLWTQCGHGHPPGKIWAPTAAVAIGLAVECKAACQETGGGENSTGKLDDDNAGRIPPTA
jgi:hypothetical protein